MGEGNETASGGGGSQGGGGWAEGGPVESMTTDAAKAEIKSLESDSRFAGDGEEMPYWDRQRMLRRRDALYRQAGPSDLEREKSKNKPLYDVLKKQGITKESLQRDQEKFQDRSDQSEEEKTLSALTTYFGGEKERDAAIKAAQGVVKKYATDKDLAFLDSSGLGNSPELIQKLVEIDEILKRGGKKKR
ncbi:MAG: hypothetical protein COS40_13985 [Deltaproteobacteria bacterium CG03_land_8_20_14_0_80_45_14]|nr:MAG: hypothetical protein COS40_13985 [Deltaproteobacteria bacterium CG03_land_8_20_14_0_80_45_14]